MVEAVDEAVPALMVMLKWPNDLMLLGKKVAGILLERSGDRIAVGFGVNLATAPVLQDRQATALGGETAPEAFAATLATSFARLLQLWRTTETSALARAWQERAHPPGTFLTVHGARDESISGRFGGLDPDGALRLMLNDGTTEIVRAGDVEL